MNISKIIEKIRLLFGGYDSEGYDRKGFNRAGLDRDGCDRRGFNSKGINKHTGTIFDKKGYDKRGFDLGGEHMDYANLKGHRMSLLEEGVLQVDLHGMSVKAAQRLIEDILNEMLDSFKHNDIRSIVLVHGYNHGNILQSMVRAYEHKRIDKIITDLHNEGITIYRLK